MSSVERVRLKVVEPFTRLESQTLVLTRLHATTDLLRRVARIQQLVKRLPGLEPLRAAHIISELGKMISNFQQKPFILLSYKLKKFLFFSETLK